MMVTIRMVAERCGMSVAAVSRALNYRTGVAPEKAEEIRRMAREMGYCPNEAARTLKTSRSHNIGVLYDNMLTHEFFSTVLEGIHCEAGEQGYEITFLNNGHGMSYYEHAQRRQCDGVIIAQGPFGHNTVTPLLESSMPVVSIEFGYPGRTVVSNDNVAAMEESVRYLCGMGHRRIAFVHGESGQVTSERLTGFYRGCRAGGISVPESYVVPARYNMRAASALATRRLMGLSRPPSCIMYPDDMSYIGGLEELERLGLSVPEDVSCFGFGGVGMVTVMRPVLSTYFQDGKEMGRVAAREMISAIEDPRCYAARPIIVPGRLMPGGTVRDLNHE